MIHGGPLSSRSRIQFDPEGIPRTRRTNKIYLISYGLSKRQIYRDQQKVYHIPFCTCPQNPLWMSVSIVLCNLHLWSGWRLCCSTSVKPNQQKNHVFFFLLMIRWAICTFCVVFTKHNKVAHFNLTGHCSYQGPKAVEQILSEGPTDPVSHNDQGLRDRVFCILLLWFPFSSLLNRISTLFEISKS